MRAKPYTSKGVESAGYLIQCPGCGGLHGVAVKLPNNSGAKWTFNGDLDRPTFSPSLLVRTPARDGNGWSSVCHSYIRDGRIQFLGDCTHAMANKTVDLPDWEDQ